MLLYFTFENSQIFTQTFFQINGVKIQAVMQCQITAHSYCFIANVTGCSSGARQKYTETTSKHSSWTENASIVVTVHISPTYLSVIPVNWMKRLFDLRRETSDDCFN